MTIRDIVVGLSVSGAKLSSEKWRQYWKGTETQNRKGVAHIARAGQTQTHCCNLPTSQSLPVSVGWPPTPSAGPSPNHGATQQGVSPSDYFWPSTFNSTHEDKFTVIQP